MALSIRYRPRGFVPGTTKVGGTSSTLTTIYISDSSGDALVNSTGHGIPTGNQIYLEADIVEYCGFWAVHVIDANTFKLSEQFNTDGLVDYVGTCAVAYTVCRTQPVDFNAVHLPIKYELKSTLWPTNSVDTVRQVSSISDDNGFVNLNLTGALKATVNDLEWVVITGQNAGVYQILTVYSTSDVTINFPFVTGVTFAGSFVQFYYNNYHARVKIYAGLDAAHRFAVYNPYELVTEIKAIPDANNVITFFVQDEVKKKLDVLKNTLLYRDRNTPEVIHDVNAYCQFYIEYAEAYDDSDNYTLSTTVGSYTTDSVAPYAINAQLPFGNRDSGFMTLYNGDNTAPIIMKNFLTEFETPVIYPGQYFDIGMILTTTEAALGVPGFQTFFYDESGTLLATGGGVTTTTTDSAGVLRFEIPAQTIIGLPTCTRAEIYGVVDFFGTGSRVTEIKSITVVQDCEDHTTDNYIDIGWKNHLGAMDFWRFQAFFERAIDVEENITEEKNIITNWPRSYNAFSDSIRRNTKRTSRQRVLLRADNLTKDQVNGIMGIKTSIAVMMMGSRMISSSVSYVGDPKAKTVLVDTDSFTYLNEALVMHEVSFNIVLTNEMPVQSA